MVRRFCYKLEEIFPISGTPERRQQTFWVLVSKPYYALAEKLGSLKLSVACVNTMACLPRAPKVTRVPRGCSGNIYVDNASYRQSLRFCFWCTPWDMESAVMVLGVHQLGVPFITFRSLSNLVSGGSALGNETATTFLSIAA
ncbi:hypothetical protein PR202_ga07429 [Eleusine coracana subsp. coracana]|uniref:Nucleoside phosphorylase domain-containing protein n=1 Tax=Eleusine coracana subsp. coracana TaxID=191504 RepID=A0AAV5BZY0_ELECO|nr:hypothetical protein PR202_ga07429 [Eleusine coracana subsp. coracana]